MSWVDEVSVKTAIGVGEGRGREVERRGRTGWSWEARWKLGQLSLSRLFAFALVLCSALDRQHCRRRKRVGVDGSGFIVRVQALRDSRQGTKLALQFALRWAVSAASISCSWYYHTTCYLNIPSPPLGSVLCAL